MDSGSESASKEAVEKREVGPMEDVVQALMERLVDPRLPWRVSATGPPTTKEAHKSVAKQMHAVVLLYNYYHRKQNTDLRFLDFASFLKLAVVLRPRLISFTKLMKENKLMDPNVPECKLSVTEKAIKDACDIALTLDVSKDLPSTELWPIYKVAVLVVDLKKENCYLEFGNITEGVWSLIEKPIKKSKIDADISIEDVTGNKRKWNDQSVSTVDSEFLLLGYNAVKDATGFSSSNLVVLETHDVYSLCNLKSAARFFIMQSSQSFSIKNQVPLKFLVESLGGPLAEKSYGSWTSTPVVEFYHLLPYAEHISRWLSRKDLSLPCLNGCDAKIMMNNSEKEIKKSKILVLPRENFIDEEMDHMDSGNSKPKANYFQKIGFDIKFNQASCDNVETPVNVFQKKAHDGNGDEKFNKIHEILDSAKTPGTIVNHGVSDSKKNDLYKILSSDSSIVTQRTSLNDLTTSCRESDVCSKNLDSNLKFYHRRNDMVFIRSDSRDSGGDLHLNDVNANESCHIKTTGMNENVAGANGVVTVLCDQNETTVTQNQTSCDIGITEMNENVAGANGVVTVLCGENGTTVIQNQQGLFHANTNFSAEEQNFHDLEDVQNALSLLYRKRHELCAQMDCMVDTLAFYEDNIQRIRDGGDIGLAHECIKSILRGDYPSLLNHKVLNKGQHATYLPGNSSCEYLEYICLKNNWRLPQYTVEPAAEGKFISKVVVKNKDFKRSSKGRLELKPSDARESAATQIIAKIQDQAAE